MDGDLTRGLMASTADLIMAPAANARTVAPVIEAKDRHELEGRERRVARADSGVHRISADVRSRSEQFRHFLDRIVPIAIAVSGCEGPRATSFMPIPNWKGFLGGRPLSSSKESPGALFVPSPSAKLSTALST